MSLDRLQSKVGRFEIAPENTSGGFPGGVGLGVNAGVVEGAAASTGGALYTAHTPKSGAAPATATSGTITHNGHGVCVIAPAGAITAVIVQVGSVAGQRLTIINSSANTVTMAAVGTSNVANGTGCVISALAAISLVWNALDSRWYQVRAA